MKKLLAIPLLALFTTTAFSAGGSDDRLKFVKEQNWLQPAAAASVPPSVVALIKAAPKKDAFGISGYQRLDESIVKADVVTINARGLLSLDKIDAPFIAIVAKDLYIEVPATRDEAAKLVRAPDGVFGDQTGAQGPSGPPGSTSVPYETGDHGGPGSPGKKGGLGKTARIPDIYVFFNRINVSAGNPATSGLLKIIANGVPGGNGGKGGSGGNGGDGARGTPSHCGSFTCDAGPGIGGNGGQAGSGGQGGDAGKGGNGANVFLVGPKSEWNQAAFFDIQQEGGRPGVPGEPGDPGAAGWPGGGGEKCKWCNGRDGGGRGAGASPTNLGRGNPSTAGSRGDRALIDRDNSDLF